MFIFFSQIMETRPKTWRNEKQIQIFSKKNSFVCFHFLLLNNENKSENSKEYETNPNFFQKKLHFSEKNLRIDLHGVVALTVIPHMRVEWRPVVPFCHTAGTPPTSPSGAYPCELVSRIRGWMWERSSGLMIRTRSPIRACRLVPTPENEHENTVAY